MSTDTNDVHYDYADSGSAGYIAMGSTESWQIFLNWIQKLLNNLSEYFKNSSLRSDKEKLRVANNMLRQLTDLQNISSLEKFAQFLSYGSHICLLLELVNSEWIDRHHINTSEQLTNSDLLTAENIDLFRSTCQRCLGISSKQILQTEDLQKLREFGRLISTFCAISSSEQFQARLQEMEIDLKPLIIDTYDPYNMEEFCEQSEYFDNKDLQQHIIDIHSNDTSVESKSFRGGSVGSDGYDVLNSEYPEPSALLPNDTTQESHVDELEDKLRKTYIKIKYITAEIESTEENYSNQLQFLDSVYRNSMSEIGYGDLIPEILDDTKISDLAAVHLSFLSDLIAAQGDIVAFGNQCRRTERIKMMVPLYTSYLKNYSRAQEKLDTILHHLPVEKQNILNKADNRAATGGSKSFDIKTNFKQPFQRFCRYPLLLRTLLDAVEKTGETETIEVISSALQTWKHVTDHLNQVKADEEMSSSTLPKVLARVGLIEELTATAGGGGGGGGHAGSISGVSGDEKRNSMIDFSNSSSSLRRGSSESRSARMSLAYIRPNYNRVEEFEKYGRFIKDELLSVVIEKGEKSMASKLMSKKYHKYNVTLTELQLIFNKNTAINFRMAANSTLVYETGNFVSTKSDKNHPAVSNIKLSVAKTAYILTFNSQFSFESWKQKLDQVVDMCKRDPAKHNGHIFEYYSFQVEKDAVVCAVCGFVLKGLVWQGHVCILCKANVHPKCRTETSAHPCQGPMSNSGKTLEVGRADGPEKSRMAARSMTFATTDASSEPGRRSFENARRSSMSGSNIAAQGNQDMDGERVPVAAPRRGSKSKPKTIEEQGWFIGMASKQVTKNNLTHFSSLAGTFLVRLSDRDPGYRMAVINSDRQIKHIQIIEEDGKFCLEENCSFDSILELIQFYSATNLSSVFNDYLDVCLNYSIAEACYQVIRENHHSSSHSTELRVAVGAAVLLRPVSAPYVNNASGYIDVHQGQLVFIMDEAPDASKTYLCQLKCTSEDSSEFILPEHDLKFITDLSYF